MSVVGLTQSKKSFALPRFPGCLTWILAPGFGPFNLGNIENIYVKICTLCFGIWIQPFEFQPVEN